MGESRGRAACRLLLELNPDVRGQHVDLPLERLLDTEPDRLLAFSVVVATDLTDRSVLGEGEVGSLVCVYGPKVCAAVHSRDFGSTVATDPFRLKDVVE